MFHCQAVINIYIFEVAPRIFIFLGFKCPVFLQLPYKRIFFEMFAKIMTSVKNWVFLKPWTFPVNFMFNTNRVLCEIGSQSVSSIDTLQAE